MSAEQFSSQHIFLFGLALCRSKVILFQSGLYFIPGMSVDQCWDHTGLMADVPVLIYADVPFVSEHPMEAVLIERPTLDRLIPEVVEPGTYLSHGLSSGIPLEGFLCDRPGHGVNDILLVLHLVAKRQRTANAHALDGGLPHAPGHLLAQLRRIELCHALQHGFQDNTLWLFRYDLSG